MEFKKLLKTIVAECLNKNVDSEFDEIKYSQFTSLDGYTFEDIVNNWSEIKNVENEDIKTVKYFTENPRKLKKARLVYDKKGLADGYHRLLAMKIINLDKFCYQYVDEYFGD